MMRREKRSEKKEKEGWILCESHSRTVIPLSPSEKITERLQKRIFTRHQSHRMPSSATPTEHLPRLSKAVQEEGEEE